MVLPLAALVLVGAGFAAWGSVSDGSAHYRTTTARVGDIEKELVLSGVIAPSGQSDLAFGTSGTVARVAVAQGDAVEAGQVIATLDRTTLRAEVDQSLAELANAKAQLVEDRAAQTDAVASTTTASTSTGATTTADSSARAAQSAPTADRTGSSVVLAQLTKQQDAVIVAQSSASKALATSTTALEAQAKACATPATTPTDGGSEDATEGTDGTSAATAGPSEECTAALAAVQSAQAATASAQSGLQKALEALGATLRTSLGTIDDDSSGAGDATGSSTPGGATGDASGEPATASSDATGSGPSGTSGHAITAATLASDQASVDRAVASLASAQDALKGAVVTTPATGTVASLSLATGDTVSRGDTIAVLAAPGLTSVAVEATAAQVAQLAQGMAVAVTPAGRTEELTGSISRVEHIPTASDDSGSESSTTYTVEIVLDGRDLGLPSGIPASVSVVVDSAEDVVLVPASAVVDGAVTVLDDGEPARVRATTGIVGDTQVEILDGLEEGDEVVLADFDADLPSADTDQGSGGIRIDGNGGPGGGAPGRGPGRSPMQGR